ncbi:MAG: copper chaperone PCu(A)C [Aeromonas sp.]|jgi:copper(I)-binding protein
MFKRSFCSVLLLACTAPAMAQVSAEMGQVRLMPPGAPNTAAFMTLHNDADKAVKLVAADSTLTPTVELHTHINDNGVMRMRQVESIEVPAKGSVVLQPGGLHLMFIGLKASLSAGQQVPLTLHFDDGENLTLTLPVKEIMPMQGQMK